ncbi:MULTISPECIES: ABC transporter permease [Sphingobacterium]|uniref:ABC transporter permease n=1 Tax=Sphingobacterium multivorum TaxID=28454 RepID=A0A653ZRP8_SPHMU|nr:MULTISPECIES: ABC transporter permease [Sphingobacterium]QQT47480.1 ABC transporter permease [Sphingobacterium multivorum]SUJ02852.1 Macrolide export ATP-binding/permease protein MacB [Sphingobacterium multivorum]VXC58140.1 ABC transporter permease [Sphingobacterium multivorum]HBI89128.1 ABC transporter permease [Sphingobacterium sp.]
MIKNYFQIAWRNLMKNKVFSFINILGLTIGIAVCAMIFLFIANQFSFDKFHNQGDHIYRVMRGFDNTKDRAPYLSAPYATALLTDYPDDIKEAVRVMPANGLFSIGNIAFNEKKLFIADDDFFELFSFPLIKGNPTTVLKNPTSVVLTETTAKKYFGNENPIGKILQLDKNKQLTVTGIAKDLPVNSHLDFDLIIPLSNYLDTEPFKAWQNNNLFTYILLDEHKDARQLEKQFPDFMNRHMKAVSTNMGIHFDLALTPLRDVYLESHSAFDSAKHGDKKVIYIFLSIAILILIIACINFMNLSTIRAVDRSKEVGLRKVLGARRLQLMGQFIGESILLTSISCALAMCLLQLLMPVYNQLLGYSLTVPWNSWPIYIFLIAVIIIVGLLAGSYPALYLSTFSPIQALKGKLRFGKGGTLFRHTLVVFQFSISILLIIGTLIISKQMKYVKELGLGYDNQQTVVIPIDNEELYNNLRTFKNELSVSSDIASVSFMSGEPGGFFDSHTFEVEGKNGEKWKSRTEFTDFDYVSTLKLKIIAGRNFSIQHPTDSTRAVLVNRSAASMLGFTPEQAIGKWIKNTIRDQSPRTIIGVIDDFNFLSLKENMDALVVAPSDDLRVALIRLNTKDFPAALKTIRTAFGKVAPLYPFEYSFLDQKFDMLYKTDLRQQRILSLFSGLAIFIACLGLYGLASFTAAKRNKEIGIRKVLGASVSGVTTLLSRDFIKPVLIALIIASPIAWLTMNKWLEDFAYRIEIQWWMFVLAGLVTIGIALITVSWQAIRTAIANPINSLRDE